MIPLRPLRALIVLLKGVATGLVDGTTAPTIPTGRAISIKPFSGYFAITPTLGAPRKSCNNPMVLRRFFLSLSFTLPSPVSATASSANVDVVVSYLDQTL